MSGVKGRSGRPRKALSCTFDEVADLTFQQAGILLHDESVPLHRRVQICLPLALKRIPDKLQASVATYQLPEDVAKQLLAEAQRNLLIYKRLDDEAKQARDSKLSASESGGGEGVAV